MPLHPIFDEIVKAHTAAVSPMPMTYKGWRIAFDPPPIPDRRFDWKATHEDYDGPGDGRHVRAATYKDLLVEIEDWITCNEDDDA